MSSDRRDVVEHHRAERRKRSRYDLEARVVETIERCSRALGDAPEPSERGGAEAYRYVKRACREGTTDLLPLVELLDRRANRDLREYGGEGLDNYDTVAISRFLSGKPRGFDGRDPASRRLVVRAFRSLVAIAEHEGLVADELQNRADAVGFHHKIGEHMQDWEMDLGDPVRLVTEQAGTLKSLFFGGTGMGKSTGLETEAEDYYQANFSEGRDYKLIDPIDLRDGESWFYDLPQQQGPLRRIREEMDLPPTFLHDDEMGTPRVEIYAPLVPGLCAERLPYAPDGEGFVVKPYVVPAASLSQPLLVSLIMSRVSDQEENIVRQAYKDVDTHDDDWNLADVVEAIRRRDELQPKSKENAIGVLRDLQNVGFIRTADSPYTIDWRDVFTDTRTITIFTQSFVEEPIGRFMAIAHVLDALLTQRESMYGVPEAVLLMRELWEIAPHRNRKKGDPRLASIQETVGDRLTTLQRQNRHYGLHFLADTQWPSDLHISVRESFNRYVAYQGNRKIIDNVFDWTQNQKSEQFARTMSAESGVAGVVGQTQPAIDNHRIEYVSPVKYAPPSHHHNAKVDDNGWRARVKYLDPVRACPECDSDRLAMPVGDPVTVQCQACGETTADFSRGRYEELRRPADVDGVDWPDSLPTELVIGESSGESGDDRADVRTEPVRAFVQRCLQPATGHVLKDHVRAAFNAFLEDHDKEPWDFTDKGAQTRFGQRAGKGADWPLKTSTRETGKVYVDTGFTQLGEKYFDQAGVDSTGEPAPADD